MKPRALLLAVAALSTAGLTAFAVQGWLDRQRAQFARSARPAPVAPAAAVLVAGKSLPAGSFIKPDDLRWQPWPKDNLDPAYIRKGQRDIKSFAGDVVRRGIVAGEPVTAARVVKPGDRGFLAAVLAPGLRAVAVPVNRTAPLAGLVFPGDRVDLILSHRFDAPESDKKREIRTASETVLTNVRVLAIDQTINDQKGKGKTGVPKTVTLEVTPHQAEMVAVAMELGKLSLSLRSLARPDGAKAAADPAKPEIAGRGRTVTRDSDVSRLIAAASSRQRVVQLLRGSKSAVLEVSR